MTFIINELIGPILQDTFNNVGPMTHGLKFACPQLIMSLVVQEDEISFNERTRGNGLVKMSFDPLFLCFDNQRNKAVGFI